MESNVSMFQFVPSKPNRIVNEVRSLFNNPEQSDVRFLVDGQTVYGHKVILGMGSPVFKSMFYGELKEKREVIEIEDLSLVGFKNAFRFIYGFKIDFELSKLHESFLAADKYLLHDFGEEFCEYVERKLNVESSCLIYDQLIKIGERVEISLTSVRAMIFEKTQETLQSDHSTFTQIDQETLISLLSLDELNIDEIDLLAAVSKWIDSEVQRQGLPVSSTSRRKVFEPIKGHILFSALTPEKIANCEEIVDLFTLEEIGQLFLSLLNKAYPLAVELKTPRRDRTGFSSVFVGRNFVTGRQRSFLGELHLSVNQRVNVHTIYLTLSEAVPNLRLKIRDSTDLDLEIEGLVKLGRWCFSFSPPVDLKPDTKYTLVITFDGTISGKERWTDQLELNYNGSVIFDLSKSKNCGFNHCIRGFDFSLLV